jgi:hypothetical protein
MAGIVHVLRDGDPRAVEEIINAYDTPDMIRVIRERFWKHNGSDWQKTREIRVYERDVLQRDRCAAIQGQRQDMPYLRRPLGTAGMGRERRARQGIGH